MVESSMVMSDGKGVQFKGIERGTESSQQRAGAAGSAVNGMPQFYDAGREAQTVFARAPEDQDSTRFPSCAARSPSRLEGLVLALILTLAVSCDGGRENPLSQLLSRVQTFRAEERFLDATAALSAAEGEFRGAERRRLSRLKARCYLDANLALRAEEIVQNLLAGDDDDAASRILLGEAERQLGRFDRAEETLREALRKRPGDLEAELSLARTLYRLGKGEESVRLFERFLQNAADGEGNYGPGRPLDELRLEYGRSLALAGRLEESADVFARLLEERPLESILYRELASTQFRLGRRDAGMFLKRIYDAVSQLDHQKHVEQQLLDSGQVAFGFGQRAFNHYREKRFLESFRLYERTLRLELPDSRLHSFYARSLLNMLCPRKALEVLDDALRRGLQPLSGVYLQQGLARLALQEREAAERSLAATLEALEREGDRGGVEKGQADGALAFMERLDNLIEMKRADLALSLVNRSGASALPPFRVWFWRARCLRELGKPAEALAACERAVSEGGKTFPEVALAFAQVLTDLRRFDQARRLLLGVMQKGERNSLEVYELLAKLQKEGIQIAAGFDESYRSLRELHDQRREIRAKMMPLPLNRERGLLCIELAGVLLKLRERVQAADLLVLGLELAPESADGYRMLLGNLTRNEDVFTRLKYLNQALKVEPDDVGYNFALARTYLSLHLRLNDARVAARRLLRLQPGEESRKLLKDIESALAKEE